MKRILHVNLGGGGIGNYGVIFGHNLNIHNDVEVLNVFNKQMQHNKYLDKYINNEKTIFLDYNSIQDFILATLKLKRIIKDFSPDVIHDTASYGVEKSVLGWNIIRPKAKLVFTVHDPVPHSGQGSKIFTPLIKKISMGLVEHYFVHGPYCKHQMFHHYNLTKNDVSVIYHGPYDFYDDNKRYERQDKTILFFGALRPNKGIELLARVIRELEKVRPDIKFIVAGTPALKGVTDSSWEKKIKSILKDLKSYNNVEVIDKYIKEEEVGTLFKKSDLTVLPYKDATQSGVAMVAMPLGSVVLATSKGDLPFVVKDKKTGFVVDYSVEELKSKIIEIFKNRSLIERVRINAKKFAFDVAGWEYQVAKCVEIY